MHRIKSMNELLTGIFLILVALLAFYRAWPLSSGTEVGLGPGYVPKMFAFIQFGPTRCMFESNFPPDNVAGSYRTVWNALKLNASGCSATEKHDLFSATARRVYSIH